VKGADDAFAFGFLPIFLQIQVYFVYLNPAFCVVCCSRQVLPKPSLVLDSSAGPMDSGQGLRGIQDIGEVFETVYFIQQVFRRSAYQLLRGDWVSPFWLGAVSFSDLKSNLTIHGKVLISRSDLAR
jgi:hypothetical protein